MKRKLPGLAILLLLTKLSLGQVIIIPIGLSASIGAAIMPEHGFLPGKKFSFNSTIEKYDFRVLTCRVELMDGKNAFVTRKTATRIIASAAMREVIEQFFVDLAAMRKDVMLSK